MQDDLLAAKAVSIALADVGIKELTGHNDGKFVSMIQRWLAHGGKWMDGQPWCACFASYCIAQAAKALNKTPILPASGSSTSIYAFAKAHGLLLTHPEMNCIGLIRGGGGGKTHEHTFFVTEVQANGFVCSVDGNWHNAVTRTSHRISDCDFVAVC